MLMENLMGSTSKVKILRLFFEYPNREFSTEEVFSNSKVGTGYGLKCLRFFADADILKIRKIGKQKRYLLNKNSNLFPILDRLFEQERIAFPKVSYLHRGILAEVIEKLDKETIILFGSVAAGTATQESDIDLLILTERGAEARKILRQIEEKNVIKMQGIILSKEKLDALISKKAAIIKNISREKLFLAGDGKILEAIENA